MQKLPPANWDASLQNVLEDMGGQPLNIHKMLANHPGLLAAWWSLRQYLVNGGDLGQRECELAILRVAATGRLVTARLRSAGLRPAAARR